MSHPLRRPMLLGLLLLSVGICPAQKKTVADLAGRRAEYSARASKLAANDVVGHFALAQWCEKKGLPMARRWELRQVLTHAPNHIGARKAMGQVTHKGKWISATAARRAKGLVEVDGKLLRKYDAYKRRHAREFKDTRIALRHRANLAFVRLADPSATIRSKALTELLSMAKESAWPEIAALAKKQHQIYNAYWREHAARPVPRPRSSTGYGGLLGINLQRSELLGMETVTTSLGTGSPVRIQLPRVKTVSIGTTIPMGR